LREDLLDGVRVEVPFDDTHASRVGRFQRQRTTETTYVFWRKRQFTYHRYRTWRYL